VKDNISRLRRVEGRHNAVVKALRQSFATGQPNADGFCAIEGVRMLEEAVRSGVRFRAVFFSHSAESKASRLLPQIALQVETLLLPDKLFASVVPSEAPQGVAALAKWKSFTLEEVLSRSGVAPIIVLAGVQDPGNLGTILRSAEAFEAAGLVVGEGTASPFNPKVVRASAGSVFRIPVVRAKLAQAIPVLKEHGVRLLATSSHKGTALPQANLQPPAAIFIGGEGAGISRDLISQMDEIVAIPHSERVESLNAGVAASIVMYEAQRQR